MRHWTSDVTDLPRSDLAMRVKDFTGIRVAVVGDMIADEYLYGTTHRISREAPVLILKHAGSGLFMGGALNSVNNLAALGARPVPVGILGDDGCGRGLLARMRDAGIDTSHLSLEKDFETISKLRIMAGHGNTTRQQVVRIDREPAGPIDPAYADAICERVRRVMETVEGIIVSDYGYGAVGDGVREILGDYIASGKIVTVDSRYHLMEYRHATVVTPNEEEVEMCLKSTLDGSDGTLHKMASRLKSATSAPGVMITRGSHGMALLLDDLRMAMVPVYGTDEIADVTGAGDTVASAMTLALCAGLDLYNAARMANFAASVVVMKSGTATLTQDELREKIEKERLVPPTRVTGPDFISGTGRNGVES